MKRVLITAFEPYGRWPANSSWLTVVELTRELPTEPKITTRLYPVDFDAARAKLEEDLALDFDYALHLGQAPGSPAIRLESVAINVRGEPQVICDGFPMLVKDGPLAYQSNSPLGDWAQAIRSIGIPAQVSYHAGVYLCNATLYLSRHFNLLKKRKTQSAFLHLPLATSQAVLEPTDVATMSTANMAAALRCILERMR